MAATSLLRAVIIDDNEVHLDLMRRSVERALEDMCEVAVSTYTDPADALAHLPAEGRVVILCDHLLPGATGLDWLPDLVRANIGPVIMVTSAEDPRLTASAFREGAADFIDKSSIFGDEESLRRVIMESLRRFRLDQTHQQLTRDLKLSNRALERQNKALSDMTDMAHRFVDDVAHEFRTPLAVIKEFASILRDGISGDVNEEQTRYLSFIIDASRDLAHLIDDFLDSSRLHARTLRVERRAARVDELVESAQLMLEDRAAAKKIRLRLDLSPDLPEVLADADKVRRMLVNLVVNAVKFSDPESEIVVRATPIDTGARIEVIDHGPGMAETEVRQLFDRFRQGDAGDRTDTKGFGLGLNIVKGLAAVNLSEVQVQSRVGEGSVFSFTLPAVDIDTLVGVYVERAAARNANGFIALLEVSRETPGPSDDLRDFLASASQPTDLILPGPRDGAVLAVGETADADAWRRELLHRDEFAQQHAPALIGRLVVRQLGVWPTAEAERSIRSIIQPSPELRCA